jgi:dTDP-4-amino-4,6-dideoxygalactose transaminase
MRVPAQVYDFPDDDIEYVTGELRCLLEQRAFLTLGRFGEEFEQAFAARHDARHAVATNSGTSALEAILRALGVAGGEVVVPTNTFAATAFAVLRAGARPVFADILPDLTVDPDDVADQCGPDTRAVVTVHIGGLVSPATTRLAQWCGQRGIPLVEDAAHAHGSALHGKPAGTFGVAGAFSFFSTKVMTTGEGGMVVTGDQAIADACRLLRDQAKVGNANLHTDVGANWRLTEVQALMGLAQLRRLDGFIERRQHIAARYDRLLDGAPGLAPVPVPPGAHHNFYKYIVVLDGADPGQVQAELKARFEVSLGGAVYDLPLHQQPVFEPYRRRALPVAEDLCRRHVCPPCYPSLTDAQVDHVASALTEIVAPMVAGREEVR